MKIPIAPLNAAHVPSKATQQLQYITYNIICQFMTKHNMNVQMRN